MKRSGDGRAVHSATAEISPSDASTAMNGILYVLVGSCIAVVIALQFFGGQAAGKIRIGELDLAATVLFVVAFAGLAFLLIKTRWGRRFRWHIKRKQIDEDVQAWTDARTKGRVRKPSIWPFL